MNRRAILLVCTIVALLGTTAASAERPTALTHTLLETTRTILDQPFYYPPGTARITSQIVIIPPKAALPLHQHPVPLFALVLEGSVKIDYGPEGTRTYRRGDVFVEAFETPHRARNAGRGVCRILTVYAGAEGVPNAEILE